MSLSCGVAYATLDILNVMPWWYHSLRDVVITRRGGNSLRLMFPVRSGHIQAIALMHGLFPGKLESQSSDQPYACCVVWFDPGPDFGRTEFVFGKADNRTDGLSHVPLTGIPLTNPVTQPKHRCLVLNQRYRTDKLITQK